MGRVSVQGPSPVTYGGTRECALHKELVLRSRVLPVRLCERASPGGPPKAFCTSGRLRQQAGASGKPRRDRVCTTHPYRCRSHACHGFGKCQEVPQNRPQVRAAREFPHSTPYCRERRSPFVIIVATGCSKQHRGRSRPLDLEACILQHRVDKSSSPFDRKKNLIRRVLRVGSVNV